MSDQPIDPSAEQPASEPIRTTPPAESGPQRTQVSSRWMRKMVIFFVVCFGLGSWGLWDAVKVYPDRGRLYAKFMLSDYLKAADETGLIMVPRRVNVDDPADEIVSLETRADQLDAYEQLRYRWLSSLRPLYGKSLEKLTEQNRAMEQLPADQREDTKTVFLDPAASEETRYRRFEGDRNRISASPDGVRWTQVHSGVFPKKALYPRGMNSQNVCFFEGIDGSKLFTIFLNEGYYLHHFNEDDFEKLVPALVEKIAKKSILRRKRDAARVC